MIGRRKRRLAEPPTATPTGESGEVAIPVPTPTAPDSGGDEQRPPPQVLDELSAAFAADQAGGLPRRRVDSTHTDAPVDESAQAAPSERADAPGAPAVRPDPAWPQAPPAPAPTMSTRAMSADELEAQAGVALHSGQVSPRVPDGAAGLVPEATKRSTRRSRREIRKEAKRAAKREAHLAKQAAKQARKATRAARKAARKGGPPVVDAGGLDAPGEGVRIITADGLVPGTATPAPPIDPGLGPQPAAGPAGRSVAVIADDELPDPVYLEGELGGLAADSSSTRSRVFIDDRDPATGTMVSLEAATTAARMEPRLRERRAAVRRAASRKRLKWVLVVTGVIAAVVAAFAVLGSGLFAIDDVEVQGAVYSRGPALDAVVGAIDGANVLRLDTDAAERELEAIPWVEDARVTTQFPHGARVEIRERQPTVTYQGADSAYRVLDEHGLVLDVVVGGRPSAYLEVMVSDGPNLAAGELVPAGYRAAAMLVQSLPAPLRAEVASLSVDTAGTDLRVELNGGVEVRFGAAQDLVDKIVRLQVALTNPDPEEAAPTQLIDVSTEDVILR